MFDASPEHSPMSGIDEYLIHNYPHPVRVMWTPGLPGLREDLVHLPGQGRPACWSCAGSASTRTWGRRRPSPSSTLRGRHTTVRAHRKLGDDRMDDGGRADRLRDRSNPSGEWRHRPGENRVRRPASTSHGRTPSGRCSGTSAAGMIVGGRAFGGVAGYDGFGRQSGWVEAHGERFELSAADVPGHPGPPLGHPGRGGRPRDVPGHPAPPFGGVGGVRRARASGATTSSTTSGTSGAAARTLRDRVHRLRFEPDTRLLVAGEVDLHFESGEVRTMTFERLGHQIAFLRCAHVRRPERRHPRRRRLARDGRRANGVLRGRPTT